MLFVVIHCMYAIVRHADKTPVGSLFHKYVTREQIAQKLFTAR